jgi:hypothetical protein
MFGVFRKQVPDGWTDRWCCIATKLYKQRHVPDGWMDGPDGCHRGIDVLGGCSGRMFRIGVPRVPMDGWVGGWTDGWKDRWMDTCIKHLSTRKKRASSGRVPPRTA